MTILGSSALVAAGSLAAGFLGALTGLGGGVVIVPLLTLGLHVDIRYAIGASLVSVIATSSGAAAAYVREGYTNIRIGMFLELATTLGAIAGAVLAARLPAGAIAVVFGAALLLSAWMNLRPRPEHPAASGDPLARRLRLEGSCPGAGPGAPPRAYGARRVPLGFALMGLAGILSGLLGIGSGALKVLAMDQAMRLPFKVSTTTSNFMIGVTAAASAGIYLDRGYIDPGLTMPVMLGVLAGSLLGARALIAARVRVLRWVFSGVIAALAVEMILAGLRGGL
ncbi:MAG: sulfite exporter TauE/SafE family protein [Elusimicrobia bacterium]|nr:sulfite exporter TauE/SafE family protein [Elusimicrobiota bacterium]